METRNKIRIIMINSPALPMDLPEHGRRLAATANGGKMGGKSASRDHDARFLA